MTSHARSETSDNQCNSQNADRRLGGIERESRTNGNEPYQVFDSNSTGGNSCREESNCRESASLGGIVRQLRELRESHLASTEANEKKLREGLTKNEVHKQELLQGIDKIEELLKQLSQSE
ncbi:MAG: hypothetical protein WBF90_21950 [Rivularia sp. (in: cyanobacteria)]